MPPLAAAHLGAGCTESASHLIAAWEEQGRLLPRARVDDLDGILTLPLSFLTRRIRRLIAEHVSVRRCSHGRHGVGVSTGAHRRTGWRRSLKILVMVR